MTECQGRHFGIRVVFTLGGFGGERKLLLIRERRRGDSAWVRMINIAAFDQPDEASMIRGLQPATMAGVAGIAHYRPDRI